MDAFGAVPKSRKKHTRFWKEMDEDMPSQSCEEGGIVFGDWKLMPMDALNWELCHYHESTRGKTKGVLQWNRLGRFYSYSTFDVALRYAADCELKDGCREQGMRLCEALSAYEDITRRLCGELVVALRKE